MLKIKSKDLKIKTLHKDKDYGPPCLHEESRQVSFADNLRKIKKFVVKLARVMAKYDGVGIAAPQVGRNIQICLVADMDGHELLIMINPKITKVSEKTNKEVEGCLSCPGREVEVERHDWIDIQYDSFDKFDHDSGIGFFVVNTRLSGIAARIAQHEIDHLRGKLIIDHYNESKVAKQVKNIHYKE